MKKQFVTYEIALKLKELGFDEKCLGMYGSEFEFVVDESSWRYAQISKDVLQAPLWQQVIDWFREKHDIHINIINKYELPNKGYFAEIRYLREDNLNKPNRYQVIIQEYPDWDRGVYECGKYEDALEVGILKAIELCKNN